MRDTELTFQADDSLIRAEKMQRDSVSHAAPEYRYENNFSILAASNDWHETPERDISASANFLSNSRPSGPRIFAADTFSGATSN